METPEYGREGIRATATQMEAQIRCFYTNAHSMGNKQEELEAIVRSESNDIVAITETWWNDTQLECCDGWLPTFQKRQARQERWWCSPLC